MHNEFEKLSSIPTEQSRLLLSLPQMENKMTVQYIALITVTNPDKLAAYKEVAADALAKHGGRVVRANPAPEALEAAVELPTVMALLEFPNDEQARAWRSDPDLAPVHALRNEGGKSTILKLP